MVFAGLVVALALIAVSILLALLAGPFFLAIAVLGIVLLVYAWRAGDRRTPEPR